MSSNIRRRISRLESAIGEKPANLGPLVEVVARDLGVSPDVVSREQAVIRARCAAACALTVGETIAFVAAELGVTPAYLRRGVEEMVSAI